MAMSMGIFAPDDDEDRATKNAFFQIQIPKSKIRNQVDSITPASIGSITLFSFTRPIEAPLKMDTQVVQSLIILLNQVIIN